MDFTRTEFVRHQRRVREPSHAATQACISPADGEADFMAAVTSNAFIVPLILSVVTLSSLPSAWALMAGYTCSACLTDYGGDVYENGLPWSRTDGCQDYETVCISNPSPPPPSGEGTGGKGSVSGDPHFVGAHGTRYDFNGLPGRDYCLFTDASVHMNMHMIGYGVNGGKPVDGKTVRTWIGKLGIMWKVGGDSHSLVLSARDGPQVMRGSGFLAGAELDHVALPALQEGETHALVGGGNLTFHHIGSWGHHKDPEDVYVITLPGLVTIRLALRTEVHRWRTRSNAWTHFDVSLSQVSSSSKVHGVLGQTFRKDRGGRSMDFRALTSLLRRPVSADGPSGAGFLDGSAADYETSGVLAADCRFSAFSQAE